MVYCILDELLTDNSHNVDDVSSLILTNVTQVSISEFDYKNNICTLVQCVADADLNKMKELLCPWNTMFDFSINYENYSQYNTYYDMMETKQSELKKLISTYQKLEHVISDKMSEYNDTKQKAIEHDTEYVQQQINLRKLLHDVVIKEEQLNNIEINLKTQIQQCNDIELKLQVKSSTHEKNVNEHKLQLEEFENRQLLFDVERNTFSVQRQKFYDETITIN